MPKPKKKPRPDAADRVARAVADRLIQVDSGGYSWKAALECDTNSQLRRMILPTIRRAMRKKSSKR